MRVVFHDDFHQSYYSDDPFDNGAAPERLVGLMQTLRSEGRYPVDYPPPAELEDLLRGHTLEHVNAIQLRPRLYTMALLAVGATIMAAEMAAAGEVCFACVRPPGHHASRKQAWGHCTFSNLALSLLRLRAERRIESAFVVDFDQHTGDGTKDVLRGWHEVEVFNTFGDTGDELVANLEERLRSAPQVDMLAVSAGFDGYLHDLGGKLSTEHYFTIGRLLQAYAIRLGHQRRYAVLEGGYYLPDLGRNVLAFCRGFE